MNNIVNNFWETICDFFKIIEGPLFSLFSISFSFGKMTVLSEMQPENSLVLVVSIIEKFTVVNDVQPEKTLPLRVVNRGNSTFSNEIQFENDDEAMVSTNGKWTFFNEGKPDKTFLISVTEGQMIVSNELHDWKNDFTIPGSLSKVTVLSELQPEKEWCPIDVTEGNEISSKEVQEEKLYISKFVTFGR